ncbi:hypothetical protein [Brevibacillus sp. HB2.2]|uniref:hypothetical protein n=1 Tax=Brevibacillus sp. HB2.2 TaxID=2738846 RepID=UPI00156B2E6D|nr:hypothetical protein [Brevibacillus sp. HB2.2]NRS50990.1 hypothetical protein [Brevibacillus sp. HB2.2]
MKLNLTNQQKVVIRQYAEWAESEANNPTKTKLARTVLLDRALAYNKLLTIDNTHSGDIKKEIQRAF